MRLVEAGSNFVCEQKREIAREGDEGKEQGKKKIHGRREIIQNKKAIRKSKSKS